MSLTIGSLLNKPSAAVAGIILLLGSLSILYYPKNITRNPAGIHAWAQSDRQALAHGFLDNGMNFFKPQTYALLKLMAEADKFKVQSPVTSVDFPIHSYVVAWVMKITGSRSPVVYRLYTLLFGLCGLLFLFLLARKISAFPGSPWFIVLFVFTSPVYCYYQDGFLQSIPSIACIFIGLYAYHLYLEEGKPRHLTVTLVFFTLAAVARIPFTVFLLLLLAAELYRVVKTKKINAAHKIMVPVALGLVVFNYLYFNKYLFSQYGSIFLGSGRSPENWQEFAANFSEGVKEWGWHYFTWMHYVLILILPGAALVFRRMGGQAEKHKMPVLFWFSLGALPACFAFLWFLHFQLPLHDYYFLDLIFPVIVIAVLAMLAMVRTVKNWQHWLVGGVMGYASLAFIEQNSLIQRKRIAVEEFYESEPRVYAWFQVPELLNKYKIREDAVLLVYRALGPNSPMNYFNKPALPVIDLVPRSYQFYFDRPYDYAIMDGSALLPKVLVEIPELRKDHKFAGRTDNLFLFSRHSGEMQSFLQFLGLENAAPFAVLTDPQDTPGPVAPGTNEPAQPADSLKAWKVNKEYPLKWEIPGYGKIKKPILCRFRMKIKCPAGVGNLQVIGSNRNDKGESPYYKEYYPGSILRETDEWQEVELWYQFPVPATENCIAALNLWNPAKAEFEMRDLSCELYAPSGQ